MTLWIFNWRGGGFNTVHADTMAEAITKAAELGKPKSKGDTELKPKPESFRPYSAADYDREIRSSNFD